MILGTARARERAAPWVPRSILANPTHSRPSSPKQGSGWPAGVRSCCTAPVPRGVEPRHHQNVPTTALVTQCTSAGGARLELGDDQVRECPCTYVERAASLGLHASPAKRSQGPETPRACTASRTSAHPHLLLLQVLHPLGRGRPRAPQRLPSPRPGRAGAHAP